MRFCNRRNISADEIFPCFRVVVTQPFGIFTAQAQHMRPHHTVVIAHLIRDLVEVDFVIRLREQAVTAEFFNARTLREVADKRFHILRFVRIVFFKVGEELTRVCLGRGFFIVLKLDGFLCLGKVFRDAFDQLFLLFRRGSVINALRQLLNTVPRRHVLQELSRVCEDGIFDISTRQNEFCHRQPRCQS